MNKKSMSETEICSNYIRPAIVDAGWQGTDVQIREQYYFTDGRMHIEGRKPLRGERNFADYLLVYKNVPLAVVEAKDNKHSIGAGMQQGLRYAEILDVPFVYSSNGDGFLAHDRTLTAAAIEQELPMNAFPSPDELWQRYQIAKNITPEQATIISQDYFRGRDSKTPRYYQEIAVNRTITAVAQNEKRILLVMATGTGKTLAAFQIAWRLWRARKAKRILFLADRNILVDQTKTGDFKHFGDKMTKIEKRQIDKSYEVYLALYQAVTG
ncbi:MAG: DEAD/DEAH box helicase family protein, partial [Chloroflexi bacterium]|nr:DEAD/DEAH box helicase family protein [Chloroflexota bacterium]